MEIDLPVRGSIHDPLAMLAAVDGETGFVCQIHHEPFSILVTCGQIQHRSARVPAADKYGLIRDQMPPLVARLEDFAEDAHLDRARGIQRLFPCGQHAPTVIVPVGVTRTGEVGIIGCRRTQSGVTSNPYSEPCS
jgi:hypothetical protein